MNSGRSQHATRPPEGPPPSGDPFSCGRGSAIKFDPAKLVVEEERRKVGHLFPEFVIIKREFNRRWQLGLA
jgi:hypothetical protein